MVALALTVSACAGIPENGPVVAVDSPGPGDGAPLRIEVGPPDPGAPPLEIVQGFFDAMSSNNLAVAREYLIAADRDSWTRQQVRVYEDDTIIAGSDGTATAAPSDASATTVTFEANAIATIDDQGHFSAAAPQTVIDEVIRLIRDPDSGLEWRIADPPDDYLISSFDLENRYASYATYFPNPELNVLVPDPVWLPLPTDAAEPEELLNLLVQAVVDGPTIMLGSGVATTFPPDTVVSSVTIEAGRAHIALAGAPIDRNPALVDVMAAQLTETLQQVVDGLAGVTLSLGGQELRGTGGPVPDLDPLTGYTDPLAYALTPNGVRSIDTDGTLRAVLGPFGAGDLVGTAASGALAVSLDETRAAVAAGGAVDVAPLAQGGERVRVFTGASVVAAPSWDRSGRLWVVDNQPGEISRVSRVNPDDGSRVLVEATSIADLPVHAFKVAPDGVRVAVVAGPEGARQLRVGHITQTHADTVDLVAVELPQTLQIAGEVLDVSWAGARELFAVVKPDGENPARLVRVQVDGSSQVVVSDVGDVLHVAAYATRPPIVLSATGNVLQQTSVAAWRVVVPGRAVAYPG